MPRGARGVARSVTLHVALAEGFGGVDSTTKQPRRRFARTRAEDATALIRPARRKSSCVALLRLRNAEFGLRVLRRIKDWRLKEAAPSSIRNPKSAFRNQEMSARSLSGMRKSVASASGGCQPSADA